MEGKLYLNSGKENVEGVKPKNKLMTINLYNGKIYLPIKHYFSMSFITRTTQG